MPGFREIAGTADAADDAGRFDWDALRQRIQQVNAGMQEIQTAAAAEQILQERAERFSREISEETRDHTEAIVFEQGGTRYAVPLSVLSEIRTIQRLTVLPKVPAGIMGVINVRGRIVIVYSLGSRELDFNGETGGSALIAQGHTAHVALYADSIIGAERVSASEIKPPPISITGKDYITGIGRDGVVFLDFEKFINYQIGRNA